MSQVSKRIVVINGHPSDTSFNHALAHNYVEQSKTARLITTLDQPGWFYRWYYGEPSTRQLKKATLQFCGVSKVKVNYVGTVRGASSDQRQKWLNQIGKYAEKDCQLISS